MAGNHPFLFSRLSQEELVSIDVHIIPLVKRKRKLLFYSFLFPHKQNTTSIKVIKCYNSADSFFLTNQKYRYYQGYKGLFHIPFYNLDGSGILLCEIEEISRIITFRQAIYLPTASIGIITIHSDSLPSRYESRLGLFA